jgi:hypothetical protein
MANDEERTTELAEAWAVRLRHTGGIRIHFDTDDEHDLYRRAAEQAGALIDRPLRLLSRNGVLHVVLDDWSGSRLEQQT